MSKHEIFKRKLAEKLGLKSKPNQQGHFEKTVVTPEVKAKAESKPVFGDDDSMTEEEYDDLMYWIRQNY